ncbi:LolA family protein [Paenibacillus periandrae]|uniref:LolA family protein n=1 Tax=Paenibacillus periandrae TaxID=1761741 RepID=UPI001F09739D|nr:hypothetical protein [Paenibacillus periandrae]
MKWKYLSLGIGIASLFVVSGCMDPTEATPADIVSKVLESQKKIDSYYAEGTMLVKQKGMDTEASVYKEWYDADSKKKRVDIRSSGQETVTSVNDGKQVIVYDRTKDSAFSMNITNDMGITSMTQREQLMNMLRAMQSTHKSEVVGEESILGMNTYHMKVSADSANTMLGDMEFWVDQKTWFILKSIASSGDFTIESTYTKVDFSPKYTDATFRVEIPKHIIIQSLQDINPIREVTLEEGERALGQPFRVLHDKNVTLTKVEMHELQGEMKRTEITTYYARNNEPSFLLSVFKTPKDTSLEGDTGTLSISIRESKGKYLAEIHALVWDEEGLRYSLIAQNPDIPLEEVVERANRMELSSM